MPIKHGDLTFTGGDKAADRSVQREAAAGRLRRVAEGIYADNNGRSLEEIVCGAWAPIVARYVPGSVLLGRSALRRAAWRQRGSDGRPTYPGWIFVTDPVGSLRKRFSMPGLEIRSVPGPGPLNGDIPYLGTHLPSEARTLLENLKPSRSREGPSRTIGREEVEKEVDRLLGTLHEDGIRLVRTRAQEIAPTLDAEAELTVLLDIIGTIAGTRKAKLTSPEVSARRRAVDPYDPECMDRLKLLATGLQRVPLPDIADPHVGDGSRACTAFIEAYFTNYIEGTKFLVEKARRIVFDHDEPDGRPADGRDVTQTFEQAARLVEGDAFATSAAAFIEEIKGRNSRLLDARPDKNPGKFKAEPNRAGNTVFVMPGLVEGTLREGFEMLSGIENPLARGMFVHALLVLVHPFDDGNGRTARIMMSKELVGRGRCRAIVPTIYRSDYIGGLRTLSGPGPKAGPFIRAMVRSQDIASRITSDDLDETIRVWASAHAFLEDEHGAQLTQPDPAVEIVWRQGIPAPASYWASLDFDAEIDEADEALSAFGGRP